jgi:hypothetical protein
MKTVRNLAIASMVAVGLAGPAGAAGNLTTGATTIKIDMTPDKKFSTTAIEMETGKSYNLAITQLGTSEMQFHAPDLFGNSYIFQVVVEGKEIKTSGVRFLEFDEGGTITINLVPVRIGSFKYYVLGQEGTMTGTVTVK